MEGYKKLASYILATVIHDLTIIFVKRWISPFSRTTDQMEQAARSGKQNIAEGYTVQSLESYIKLCGVAEGSIKELAIDYEDFLRQRGYDIWDKRSLRLTVLKMIQKLGNLGVLGRFGNLITSQIPQISRIILKKQET